MPDERRCLTDDAEAVLAGDQSFNEPSARLANSHAFDEDYVRRLAEGDRSVEDHFIAYFGELLTIKLRARLRSRAMIEEIRQETFVRVFQALRKGSVQHPERLGGFVHAVCNNVLFEQFRYEKRHPPMSSESDDLPDHRIDLDAPLISEERSRLVESVLAKLSNRDREMLRLILGGVDQAEACQRLGVRESYLRVLLHRAKSRFRDKLAESGASAVERPVSGNQQDPVKRRGYAVHYTMRYSDGT